MILSPVIYVITMATHLIALRHAMSGLLRYCNAIWLFISSTVTNQDNANCICQLIPIVMALNLSYLNISKLNQLTLLYIIIV